MKTSKAVFRMCEIQTRRVRYIKRLGVPIYRWPVFMVTNSTLSLSFLAVSWYVGKWGHLNPFLGSSNIKLHKTNNKNSKQITIPPPPPPHTHTRTDPKTKEGRKYWFWTISHVGYISVNKQTNKQANKQTKKNLKIKANKWKNQPSNQPPATTTTTTTTTTTIQKLTKKERNNNKIAHFQQNRIWTLFCAGCVPKM